MKRFKTSLLWFLSAMPWASDSQALPSLEKSSASLEPDPVSLRPLNLPSDNRFAAHRSHSSHASHRSGSGGYTAPRAPAVPAPTPAPPPGSRGFGGGSSPVDPGRAVPVTPKAPPVAPALTIAEKKALQVMRVQIALSALGLYTGDIDGVLGDSTKEAVKRFQKIKGIKQDGLMSTDTLNALNVPAVP